MKSKLSQRKQYTKGGIVKKYWDLRDKSALSFLREQDQRVVDVGCGEGITLERAKKLFPKKEFIGIDSEQENIDICHNFSLKVHKGRAEDLPLFSDEVDFVLFLEVIEHLEKPEIAVDEINRILKPGGRLAVVFPQDFNFKLARILTLKFKEAFYPTGHTRQWTPKDMIFLLKKHGFEIKEVKCLPFFFWPFSLHCLVIADKK